MKTQIMTFYEKLSPAQRTRIDRHAASVGDNLEVKVGQIDVPGYTRNIRTSTVRPGDTETVGVLSDNLHLFRDLKHINVILTNACNLSCPYCYEQHDTDFGRFTPESLKRIYDFQLASGYKGVKAFQFFGGEPMIHKGLVLEFLERYKDHLELHGHGQMVGLSTNGVLLTPDFLDKYFSYSFTMINISLDTDVIELDGRDLTSSQMDHILKMIEYVPQRPKDQKRLSVRCTISVDNVPRLGDFIDHLYSLGVRTMVVHPLTMDSLKGFVEWSGAQWGELQQTMHRALNAYDDFTIQFSEGIGFKHANNCMIGSDMVAVDASGDFSGCYFFTNHKKDAPHTILGNILNNTVYLDRYQTFESIFAEALEHPQCKACDLKKLCYQCPAGNLDTSGQLFRPDSMCQSVVGLFLQLLQDRNKKQFEVKFRGLREYSALHGEQHTFAKSLTALMYRYVTSVFADTSVIDTFVDELPAYEVIIGVFKSAVEGATVELTTVDNAVADLRRVSTGVQPATIHELYNSLLKSRGIPLDAGVVEDATKRLFYLTLCHLLILDRMEKRPY